MSSYTDIIKYSATLYIQRDKIGRSKSYTALVIFAAVATLTAQLGSVVYFNVKANTSLFCGDVVRMIDTQNLNPEVLFLNEAVLSYNASWNDVLYQLGETMDKKLNKPGMTEDDLDKAYQKYFNQIAGTKIKFLRYLSSSWYSTDINSQLCIAPTLSENFLDIQRAQDLGEYFIKLVGTPEFTVEAKKLLGELYESDEAMGEVAGEIGEKLEIGKWQCPKQWRQDNGQCAIKWNCSIAEWNTFCNEQQKFATTVSSSNKPIWWLAIVILAATITSDIYQHLVVLRQVPIPFKILLVIQCIISVNIGILNASMCAGQSLPVDILTNAVGLLVLNDIDNIIGNLFLILRNKRQEEDVDPFADNMELKDKVFAWWLTFWHLLLVVYYALYFVGVYQFETPEQGYPIIALWQPYSPIFFPIFVAIWYCICYMDRFENLRQKCVCCFSQTSNLDTNFEEVNNEMPNQIQHQPNEIQMEDKPASMKKSQIANEREDIDNV